MDKIECRIDFETRSKLSIMKHTSARYAQDESTMTMCMRYKFTDDDKVYWWYPFQPHPTKLFDHISSGKVCTAHNAEFEQNIWRYICVPKFGFPPTVISQWRCSAAKAAAHALPRALDMVGPALDLPVIKDAVGKKIMQKMARPRNQTKNKRRLWNSEPDDFKTLLDYCGTDVLAENAIHEYLPELIQQEQKIWELDQKINNHGVQVDIEACKAAVEIMDMFMESYNNEMKALTEGAAEKVTSSAAIADWIWDQKNVGLKDECLKWIDENKFRKLSPAEIKSMFTFARDGNVEKLEKKFTTETKAYTPTSEDLTFANTFNNWVSEKSVFKVTSVDKDSIENLLNEDMPSMVTKVLKLKQKGGKTSIAKYKAFLNNTNLDGRVRGLFLYAGANTLRWAGKLVQLHNLPQGILGRDTHEESEAAMREAVQAIKEKDIEAIQKFGDVQTVLSSCIRGMIIPKKGHKLLIADYAAIEARVLFWLAQDEDALDIFRNEKDIYKDMASEIYRVLYEEVTKPQRQMGKQSILGLGYQMGAFTFNSTCEKYKIDLIPVFANKIWDIYSSGEKTKEKLFTIMWEEGVFDDISSKKKDDEISPESVAKGLFNKTKKRIKTVEDLIAWAEKCSGEWEDKTKINFKRIFSQQIVNTYRTKYKKVRDEWYRQEKAAVSAIQTPNVEIKCGRITWYVRGRFLHSRLPSGRCNMYCDPWIEEKKTSWGEMKPTIHFMGMKEGQWIKDTTYGGKLVENLVQGIARDLLCEGMQACEDSGYPIIMHVHDEAVTEVPEDFGSVEEFENLIATLPEWAYGLPLKAEGEQMERYRK